MKKKARIYVTSVLLVLLALTAMAVKDQTYMQVKVYYDSAEELRQLQLMHLDIIEIEEDFISIVALQSDMDKVIQSGFEADVIHEDFTKFYQSRLDSARDMGGYKTLSELSAHADQTVLDHPGIARRVDIGLSLEGRTMWAVKISDNPDIDEDEPEILITGAVHAREVITPEICVSTIDMLTDGYGNDNRMTYLVDNREIWFIPVINVDGYYHNEVIAPEGGGLWRKNRRDNGDGSWGIDLNRNFGYMWGYDNTGSSYNPSSEMYRGTGPFSEPATQNVRDFTIGRHFELSIHFHGYGSWLGPPYFYDMSLTPDEPKFIRVGAILTAISGYDFNHGIMNGCHEDWDYGEQTLKNKILPFIIEVGEDIDGFWPSPERVPILLDLNVPMCLMLASVAGRLDDNFEDNPTEPILAIEDTVDCSEYNVTWTVAEDPANPLTSCEIREYPLSEEITETGGLLDFYSSYLFTENNDRYYSSPSSYFSGHIHNQISFMQTTIPYTVKSGDILEFRTYYDIQPNYDYAYVEISTDGENFTPIDGNITTDYNPQGKNRGNGITGTSGGEWISASFDLSDFVGQDVYYKFSYYADQSMAGEGFYIDDMHPINIISAEQIITNIEPSGTYTFYSHEPGWNFYKIRGVDVDGQWSEYSETVGTYVKPAFICGDADGDEAVNILDVVFLLNYKYKSGPEPEILESSDVNSDTRVDILDIVYVINFKYKGGPEPICP